MSIDVSNVSDLLQHVSAGERKPTAELLPIVYQELRSQAARQMALERANHTLQATALVHDAFLRISEKGSDQRWDSVGHFYAAASQAMRRILIDHARSKARLKRGGDRIRVELSDIKAPEGRSEISSEQLLDLDDALQKLELQDEQVAELVRLRLYAGLSVTEAAAVLGISRTSAYERWEYAMSWFHVELHEASS